MRRVLETKQWRGREEIHRRRQENFPGARVACSDVVAGLSTVELLRGCQCHESFQVLVA